MITQEFGTRPGLLVAKAMIFENAAFWHGNEEDKKAGAKLMKDAFYVQTNYWKNEIVERGKKLYFACLKRDSFEINN